MLAVDMQFLKKKQKRKMMIAILITLHLIIHHQITLIIVVGILLQMEITQISTTQEVIIQ